MSDNVRIRSGSQSYIDFTIKKNSLPVDLTTSSEVILRMYDENLGTAVSLSTLTDVGILDVYDDVGGIVRLTPTASTFSTVTTYSCYFDVISSGTNISYPDDTEFYIHVIDRIV